MLGVIYCGGQGVPQDYAEAMNWFHTAAEQGHAKAQHNLGVMYASGRGIPQNQSEAYFWFSLSAAMSDGEDIELSVKSRDHVAGELTYTQLAEQQARATRWFNARQ